MRVRHNVFVAAEAQPNDQAQSQRVAALSIAERLALLDRLCRDLTKVATFAQRVK